MPAPERTRIRSLIIAITTTTDYDHRKTVPTTRLVLICHSQPQTTNKKTVTDHAMEESSSKDILRTLVEDMTEDSQSLSPPQCPQDLSCPQSTTNHDLGNDSSLSPPDSPVGVCTSSQEFECDNDSTEKELVICTESKSNDVDEECVLQVDTTNEVDKAINIAIKDDDSDHSGSPGEVDLRSLLDVLSYSDVSSVNTGSDCLQNSMVEDGVDTNGANDSSPQATFEYDPSPEQQESVNQPVASLVHQRFECMPNTAYRAN